MVAPRASYITRGAAARSDNRSIVRSRKGLRMPPDLVKYTVYWDVYNPFILQASTFNVNLECAGRGTARAACYPVRPHRAKLSKFGT